MKNTHTHTYIYIYIYLFIYKGQINENRAINVVFIISDIAVKNSHNDETT